MKLRFNLTEPTNTGSPNYTICNQASSAVDYTNLSLLLKIDSTTIINTSNLAGVSFPTAPITTTNGYSVTVDLEPAGLYPAVFVVNVDLDNIWDSTTAQFTISKTGFWDFSKIFEIYGYDLGNSLDAGITTNPNFGIVLLRKANNEVDGNQTKAYSSFVAYRKPYTSELHVYKNNSGGGEVIYYNSDLDVLNISVDGFICITGEYEIKQTTNLYYYDNTGRHLLDTCTTALLTINDYVLFPTFGTSTTCVDCDTECVVLNTENTSTTNIDYSLLTTFYVDDTEENPYLTQYLIYRLINSSGEIIQEETHDFTINPLPFVYDPTLYTFAGFVIPEVGDYIIQVELSVPNLYKCTKNYPIKSCNFYEIKNTDCNEFTVYNKSFEDFTLTVSELQDDKTFLEVSSITVEALGNAVISHTNDNIYTYTVTKDDVDYTYVVVNYCNLRNCLLLGLTNLICPTTGDCSECREKDYYDFNALIINAHTYFNMLNNEYNFNYMYEALTPSKIDELHDLKSFLTRFEEYCVECTKACGCS